MKRTWLLVFISILTFACNQPKEQKADFMEIRITRSTALEGGEIFILRKIDKEWSALLIGDGERFSCQYQKSISPKSGWENTWNSLQKEGLLEIPEGEYTTDCCTDGDGYGAEIFYQGKLRRFSFHIPEKIPIKEAKQIQNIGNIISDNFDTPMFYADYSRNDIGDYLIKNCEELKANKKVF
jgi:hypothetical protein